MSEHDDRREQEKKLRAEILERVEQLARVRNAGEGRFEPGKTYVRYAGRVYDEREMVNLVDSALEFWLTAGRWHAKLETDLARWYGVAHARLVNSGSSANLLAIAAIASPVWGERRLKPGDEVITVAAGFPTTVAPIVQHGAVPVFVDVELPGYNLDVSQLEAALSPKTRAVMLAHTLGNPFDLEAVAAFCKRHDLWLVEDNCDAAGSLYAGKKTGSFGDLATLSFYPPHHMTMGEGGAVLCRDEAMKKVVESLRDWGRDCWCRSGVDNTCGCRFEGQFGELPRGYDHKYVYSHLGYNLKVTDLQAAVGCAQLEKLDGFVAQRRANWRFFREALGGLGEFLVLPEPTPGSEPSWFGFMVTVRPGAPFSRGELVGFLEGRRVQTRMLFAGNLVRQPALVTLAKLAREAGAPLPYRTVGALERTDEIMNRSFWIGVYPGLTEPARAYVAEQLQTFVRERAARARSVA